MRDAAGGNSLQRLDQRTLNVVISVETKDLTLGWQTARSFASLRTTKHIAHDDEAYFVQHDRAYFAQSDRADIVY